MLKLKSKNLLLLLLCLIVSAAVRAEEYVHPTIANDAEVSIFILSPESNVTFTFWGEGGDYKDERADHVLPGDAFTLIGQQQDGLYLYKWTRPDGATGIPTKAKIYKNGSADENKIYDGTIANHGIYMEASNVTIKDTIGWDSTKTVTAVKTGNNDPLAVKDSEGEHSLFFETPTEANYLVWVWAGGGTIGGDQFAENGTWPGDTCKLLGKLPNGNNLYKWTQKKLTDVMPEQFIVSRNNDGDRIIDGWKFNNNGYLVENIDTLNKDKFVLRQFGRAYADIEKVTVSLDPLAHLDNVGETSIFLESPDADATYYIWPYSGNGDNGTHPGEYFTGKNWPGSTFTKVEGQLKNGNYLYKWTLDPKITGTPTQFSICKSDGNHNIYADKPFQNHGYFVEDDASGTPKVEYKADVTRLADGSYIPQSRTTAGKRVIYELNVGSFTQEGTFNAAKAQLSYLKSLGIDVIWIMPIWERGGGDNPNHLSPYAVKDYSKINSKYGTEADLKSLVDQAHTMGMDVWLDFVPNHTAYDNVWVTTHPEYYTKVDGKMVHPASDGNEYLDGQEAPKNAIVYNDVYQLDYVTLYDSVGNVVDDPDNFDGTTHNPATEAMKKVMAYWLTATGVDGFRFDYVSSPNISNDFWAATLDTLKTLNPQIQFLAENDFTQSSNVSPNYFDYDYAWGFNDKLRAFGKSNNTYQDISASNPQNNPVDLAHFTANFLTAIKYANIDPMIYLTNHDQNWNPTVRTMKDIWGDNRYAMTVLEFTMPGMPLIYNGQEQDGTLALNYFEDAKIDWSKRDYNMLGLIHELAQLKHTNNAVSDGRNGTLRGETRILNSYDHNVFAYERIRGNQHVIVVLNLADVKKTPRIVGATPGTWHRLVRGSNTQLDNSDHDENIGETWDLVDIPAHGFDIYTYTGETPEYESGIFLVTDDSWNTPNKHKMVYTSTDNNYDYYRIEIKATDFDSFNTPAGKGKPDDNKLKFKFQEYYDFLNLGTVCKTDQMYGAGSNDKAQFEQHGTTVFGFKRDADNADKSFSLVQGNDSVEKYIISFLRSKKNADEGTVVVEFVKAGDLQSGYYLLTPENITAQTSELRHMWRFKYKFEDEDAVSDQYMLTTDVDNNGNDGKTDLCSYTIDASHFFDYIPQDRQAGNTIQFRIKQYAYMDDKGAVQDNDADIVPNPDDKNNDNSTFDETKGNKVYEDSHWETYQDQPDLYFKILYSPNVEKYIIQMWKANNQTRVRVYYVIKYNYNATSVDDAEAATGDDGKIYLYNVDLQKFMYLGNNRGTAGSILYDDLGTPFNIRRSSNKGNANYKVIKTDLEDSESPELNHMLGMDDSHYTGIEANNDYTIPDTVMAQGDIYTNVNSGDKWLFSQTDSVAGVNTYTLRLYSQKDHEYHLLYADHKEQAKDMADKVDNTKVKFRAIPRIIFFSYDLINKLNKKYEVGDTIWDFQMHNQVNYDRSRGRVIRDMGGNGRGKKGHDPNSYASFHVMIPESGVYMVDFLAMCQAARGTTDSLNVYFNGVKYNSALVNTGGQTNVAMLYDSRAAVRFYVHMDKGDNYVEVGKNLPYPKIAFHLFGFSLVRPDKYGYGTDYYGARWQLITRSELWRKLKNKESLLYGGTTPDATFLLKDPGFSVFNTKSWDTDNGVNGSTVAFNKGEIAGTDTANVMYTNAHITGKGKVYQDVALPNSGIYQFDAYGFASGSPTKLFYQYATSIDDKDSVTSWSGEQGSAYLKSESHTYNGKESDIASGKLFYGEAVLGDEPQHMSTQFIYLPPAAAQDKEGNYRLRLGFDKTDDKPGDYTAVDDIHLHYSGEAPFVLDDSYTAEQADSAQKKDDRSDAPVYIKRKFWPNVWNTLVLPVTISTTQLRAMFGDDVEVATPYGLDDDNPYLIRFTPVRLSSGSNAIKAGKFYIVRPHRLYGQKHVMKLKPADTGDNTQEPYYETIGTDDAQTLYYLLGNHDVKDLDLTIHPLDVNTYNFHGESENHKEHNTIKFVGSYSKTHAPDHSYIFTNKGRILHLDNNGKGADLNGFRFYIVDENKGQSSAKLFEMGSLSDDLDAVLESFNKTDGDGKTADGIQGVTTVDDGNDHNGIGNGDIYDLSGRIVARNGETANLPSGVYICNGKKFIKD